MVIVRDSYVNVTYRYELEIDNDYLKQFNEWFQSRLVNPDPSIVIDEALIKKIMDHDYDGDFDVELKNWNEGSYKTSFFCFVEEVIDEDIWECDSEMIDSEGFDSDTWIED